MPKLLKDYQEEEGFIIKSPRDALKQAFQSGLIENGQLWLDALKDRNMTVHTYREQTAIEVEQKITGDYFELLERLHNDFKNKLES